MLFRSGILQARILEWVAVPSPGDFPNPGIKPQSPTLQAGSLPSEPPGKSVQLQELLFAYPLLFPIGHYRISSRVPHVILQVLISCLFYILQCVYGLPDGSDGQEPTCNAGDPGLIPGLGRSPGGGHGNPLQYSCLENPHAEEPDRLQSMGSQRVGHDRATNTFSLFNFQVMR